MRLNRAELVCHISSDVVFTTTEDQRLLATFSVLEAYEGKPSTFNVAAWGGAARVASYFKNGDHVYIEGKLHSRNDDCRDVELVAWTIFKIDDSHKR